MESSERSSSITPPALGSEQKVIVVASIGIALAATAAIIGAIFPSGPQADSFANDTIAPARLILSIVGMIVAGAAVSLRPKWYASWLLASAASLAAGFGFPNSWYTFSFAAFVFAGLGCLGAVIAVLPYGWRIAVVGALPVLHFCGILTAVLSPSPSPQLITNAWTVIYRPYLQFAYLNNAYQFYSPDPGPASEVWFCIEYETRKDDKVQLEALQYNDRGEPLKTPGGLLLYAPVIGANDEPQGAPVYDSRGNWIFTAEKDRFGNEVTRPMFDDDDPPQPRYLKEYKWIKLPRRPQDRKDPLFQTYYRRLAISENVTHSSGFSQLPINVQLELRKRRLSMTPEMNIVSRDKQIPLDENRWNIEYQYRLPTDQIQDLFVPSYVRHVAGKNQKSDRGIAGIKVYRVTHMIPRLDLFVGADKRQAAKPWSAYDPSSYLPYYLGTYDATGKLLNPSDPLLNWLIPIYRRDDISSEEFPTSLRKMKDYKRLYNDYLSVHATGDYLSHMEGELEK